MSLSLEWERGQGGGKKKQIFFDLLPRTTKMSFKDSLPRPNRLIRSGEENMERREIER